MRTLYSLALALPLLSSAPGADILISKGTTWSYLDDGSDQGTSWTAVSFDDSSWATGSAQLGYGDGDEDTVVSFGPDSGDKYITTYFRHEFNSTTLFDDLSIDILRDDGAVIYLNGVEVMRTNMPSGTIDYLTEADTTVGGSSEDDFTAYTIDETQLIIGTNVIAVEIHQTSPTSSDISFDFELSGTPNDGSLSYSATEDAYIQKKSPTTNFDGDDLFVEIPEHSVRSHFERSLLRFNVTGTSGVPITSVYLQLTEGTENSSSDCSFEVRSVTGTWTETDVTWSTAPGVTGMTLGGYFGGSLSEDETIYIPIDLGLIQGDGTYDLALIEMPPYEAESSFDSSEDNSPPKLLINPTGIPPMAAFSVDFTDGPVPYTVPFANHSNHDATSWLWDFGDGSTSTLESPSHTYTVPGRYSVTLTVTTPLGSDTVTRPDFILAHPADQTAGQVLSWNKISSNSGLPLKNEDLFARGTANIGDLDGNGVIDFISGAVGDEDGGVDAGAAWIVFMNADGTMKSFTKISPLFGGPALDDDDGFGRAVAGIGDLDGDGYPDVAVGANDDDDGGTNHGAFYIFFMNPDGTIKSEQKISDTEGNFTASFDSNDDFGRGIACLGDMDGDGVQDLAVGATGDDDERSDGGAVYILFMNTDGTVKSHTKIGENQGGMTSTFGVGGERIWFGMSVAALGDVDSDGVTDIAVGGILDDARYHASGSAWVILLNSDGTVKSDYRINADEGGLVVGELEASDEFGGAVAGPGDIDGDGVPDLAVTSIRDNDNDSGNMDLFLDSGGVYIFFLNPDSTVRDYQKISDTRGGFSATVNRDDRIGESLASPGDFNGDGTPDLVIGSRFDDAGGSNRGAFYILYLNDGTLIPPSVAFAVSTTAGQAPLLVDFTDQSTGDIDTWFWNFGDGGTSTEQNPSYTYTAMGSYTVRLTVTGPAGTDSKVLPNPIRVDSPNVPLAQFSGTPTSGEAPLDVDFTDSSLGFIENWTWDFGDGSTTTLQNPSHTYVNPGSYTVMLNVANSAGNNTSTQTNYITVDATAAPVADFSASPTSGDAPLAVTFTDLSLNQVTSWLWDFGDGGTSTAQDPGHTYTVAGTYSVSLTATGPGGSDTLTQTNLISVGVPPPPTASFSGAPTSGVDPLFVAFSDLSSGVVSSWSWDFGDGGTSTEQNPGYTYLLPGLYSVSLTATGTGGSDTSTLVDYIDVQNSIPPGFDDSSFEMQLAGAAPIAPWTIFAGSGHLAHPVGSSTDGAMPTDGSQWLEVSAADTTDATPPSNPGGVTTAPVGGAGIMQTFRYASGRSQIEFEAVFLLDGPLASATTNDWMSVDVTDGATTYNLYYADSFSSFPNTSAEYGLPMTGTSTTSIDLVSAFPGATENTLFTLTIQVGNGGDGADPSRGYVDNFSLKLPATVSAYGCGVNPAGSLVHVSGVPAIGTSVVFGVDNPLGTQSVGSLPSVVIALAPDPNFPCGTLVPGFGMAGPGANGELLVSLPGLIVLPGPAWSGPGNPVSINIPIPNNVSLIGLKIYVQGRLIDPVVGSDVPVGVTGAFELTIGP